MSTTQIDAKWVAWIQENLVRGSTVPVLSQILADNFSITIAKATAIIEKVKNMPVATSTTNPSVKEALERREWMMKTLDLLQREHSEPYVISRIKPPLFSDFLDRFYSQNKPVLLDNAIADWPAAKWVPETLLKIAGETPVEVQFNRNANPRFEMDSLQHKKTLPFSQYYDLVTSTKASNDFYMTANNAKANEQALKPLYDDMANIGDGYFDESQHNSRSFIWFGPKGNYTPLHHDQTNNMFVQVYGTKKFHLLPPNQTPYLYNETAVFSPIDLRDIDDEKYPLAKNTTPIIVTLAPGDTLFIPVGWWHQVESLDVSISITMTNFNARNAFL